VSKTYRGTKEYLLIYSELIRAAQYRGVVTYQELADLVVLPLQGNFMGQELAHHTGEISDNEVAHGRPMLSAIVVGVSGKPGEVFSERQRNSPDSRAMIPANKMPSGKRRRRLSMRYGKERSIRPEVHSGECAL
jgi:hypothetical protein